MSWSTWQDGRWRRRNHCGCIHSEGTQDHNKLQHRRAARESLKEAVTCSSWPWVQLLLGLIDIQEKPVMNTKDILEKNPNVLNTDFFFFVEITVIPDLKFCVGRKWPRSIYFVFLFKQNSLPRTINKEFNKTNNRTCTHMDMHVSKAFEQPSCYLLFKYLLTRKCNILKSLYSNLFLCFSYRQEIVGKFQN